MRLPSPPPTFDELLKKHKDLPSGEELAAYLRAVGEVNEKYMTWDEAKLKPNLVRWGVRDPESLWFFTKLGRMSGARRLPLRDKNGAAFQYSMPDLVMRGLHHADKHAAGELASHDKSGVPPSKQYVVSSIIEEAISSSILEGAATTRKVAKEMIKSGRPPRTTGERMALNNYLTLLKVKEYLRADPRAELTIEILHDLHRTVAAGTLEDEADLGAFRRTDDIAVVDRTTDEVLYVPPPSKDTGARMQALVDFANEKTGVGFIHPVIRGMIIHFMTGYEHPYVDGNGRIARALFYWYLLRSGYRMIEYYAISKAILDSPAQYRMAYLNAETDSGDLTYFLIYHLNMIAKAIGQFQAYVSRKSEELAAAASRLKRVPSLNYRQIALLYHAIRHPEIEYSIGGHAGSHGVTRMTSRSDLYQLVGMGLLRHRKIGRRVVFEAAQDIAKRVEELIAASVRTADSGLFGT